MARTPLITSVSQDFGGGPEGTLSLEMLQYPVGLASVAIKMIDSVQDSSLAVLYASEGTVEYFAQKTEVVAATFTTVNGDDRVTTEPGQKVDSVIFAYDQDGNLFPCSFKQLNERTVVFNKKFFGLVKMTSYTRNYYILKYDPRIDGTTSFYGTVAAFHSKKLATLDVVPPTLSTSNQIEVYKVTSLMVVNDVGTFEYPDGNPGWPNGNAYAFANIDPSRRPEPNSGVVPKRVHEVCMLDTNNVPNYRNYSIPTEEPFVGSARYLPKITFETASTSGLTPTQQSIIADIIAARKKLPFPYGHF